MTPSDAAAPAAFARLVGISRQAVVELQLRGTLTRGATLGRWLREYTGQLRATAAGRAGALTDSRRLLDEARAAEVAARNAERRRTMAAVGVLDAAVGATGAAVADELAALPAAVVRAWPDATAEQRALVHGEMLRAVTLARSARRLPLIEEDA